MDIVFSSLLDQVLLAIPLLMSLWMLVVGIGVVVFGSYLHSHPGKFWGNHAQTWQQLVKWQVVTTGFAPPALLEEFARSRDFTQASAIIGIGLAFSLEAIGNVIVPWVVTGTFTMVNGQVFIAEVYLSYLLGYGLGYFYGVWRLRRLTAGTSTYADLQRRALSQYRSPLFPWSIALFCVVVTFMTLFLTPYLGPNMPFEVLRDTKIELPIWVLGAIPAAMFLLLGIGEIVMGGIARLPRLSLTTNPYAAQRADNLLRALTIGMLQGFELVVISGLGNLQNLLLMANLEQVGFWHLGSRPYGSLLDVEFWLCLAFLGLGFLLQMLAGRVGGSISGWPWQPVRVP